MRVMAAGVHDRRIHAVDADLTLKGLSLLWRRSTKVPM
jgi:hypothetical protein